MTAQVRRRVSRAVAAAVIAVIAAAALTGCTHAPDVAGGVGEGSRETLSAVIPGSSAAAELGRLRVAPAGSMAGYRRDQFGPAWADTDHNHCDQRNDVLARDLTGVVRSGRCTVVSGRLDDPYTGRQIGFVRGRATSTAIQIDHVVALGDAWRSGAAGWDPARREAFATDEARVLLAVDGPANEAKGDRAASDWVPPNRVFRCRYVARQVWIKRDYRLSVTARERAAMAAVLASCPGQRIPSGGGH